MNSRLHATVRRGGTFSLSGLVVAVTGATLLMGLSGCVEKAKDKPASQTAAKVNKEEISVDQITFVLQQQRGLAPESAASASKQVLERLIDQELALQKSQDQKLDREPRVVQLVEAARREIVARAYAEKIAAAAPRPSPAEIKAYYEAHPALFKERRVYSLQEIAIQARPDQIAGLQARLTEARDIAEFVNHLKVNEFKFGVGQAVRSADQLPAASAEKLAQLKDGQGIFNATPTGAQIVILMNSRSQPVDETRAAAAIEQLLLNERKRKIVEDDLKALRAAAKVEYVGEFAKGGSTEVTPPASAASGGPSQTLIVPAMPAGSIPGAAPPIGVAPRPGTSEKGVTGPK